MAQGRLPEYLDLCAHIGFTRIECGEGFTELTAQPVELVGLAAQRGLDVQFELGKKHDGAFTDEGVDLLIDQGKGWLDAGALQLVVEARESAAGVGLFDDRAAFRADLADRIVDAFGHDLVSFEAPTKASQFALLDHFGPRRAALQRAPGGAAARRDLPPGPALRRLRPGQAPPGAHGAVSLAAPAAAPCVEIASYSAGGPFPWRGTVVAVDVIRSTTTAITAVERGHRCFVATTVDDAKRIAAGLSQPLLAGELHGRLISGFDVGNSPAAIAERTDVDRPIVLLSSSGTALMVAAGERSRSVLVACLRNVSATVAHLADRGGSVVLLGAETRGEFREEDQLCCAAIAGGLIGAGFEPSGSDPGGRRAVAGSRPAGHRGRRQRPVPGGQRPERRHPIHPGAHR